MEQFPRNQHYKSSFGSPLCHLMHATQYSSISHINREKNCTGVSVSPYNHIWQALRDWIRKLLHSHFTLLFMKNWAYKGAVITVIVVKEQDNEWCTNGCEGLREIVISASHYSIYSGKVPPPCHSVLKELRPPVSVFWQSGTMISVFLQWAG